MKISTFNIQNDYKYYKEEKSKDIYNYLKNNDLDVLGLQEVFSKINKDITTKISNVYNMVGKYRGISRIILKRFNEKNPIITKYKIISYKTYQLPHFPSILKRVMTHAVIDYNGKEISIYNTHLEVRKINVKVKQLDKIYQIIKDDKRPLILMGDFNLKNNNQEFNGFITKLENIGINRIILNEKTLKQSKYSREIDHIFYSKEFKLVKKEVIKDLKISDHYPVLVELKII